MNLRILFQKNLVKQCECQVLAIDLRGHGNTFTSDDNNLSMDTFTKYVILLNILFTRIININFKYIAAM